MGKTCWVRFRRRGMARFRRVSDSPKQWSTPFVSISAGERGKIQAVFRIGYESIDQVAP
jgi:hypothetical protein